MGIVITLRITLVRTLRMTLVRTLETLMVTLVRTLRITQSLFSLVCSRRVEPPLAEHMWQIALRGCDSVALY